MVKEISFYVRDETGKFLPGKKTQMLPAMYEEHEVKLMRDLIDTVDHNIGDKRSEALNSAMVLHELKALLGAKVLTDEEAQKLLGEQTPVVEPEKAPPAPPSQQLRTDPTTMPIPF